MASAMLEPEHFEELYPPKKLQKQQPGWFSISSSLLKLTELTKRAASIWAPHVGPRYEVVEEYVSPPSSESKQPHAPKKPSPLRKSCKLVQVN